MTETRKPFWAKCLACCHCWIICYAPMEMRKAAELMKAAACPKCGERKQVGIAKQADGLLQEGDAA